MFIDRQTMPSLQYFLYTIFCGIPPNEAISLCERTQRLHELRRFGKFMKKYPGIPLGAELDIPYTVFPNGISGYEFREGMIHFDHGVVFHSSENLPSFISIQEICKMINPEFEIKPFRFH